jgi:hypothetical protein
MPVFNTFHFETLGWLSRWRGSIQEVVERIGRLFDHWVPIAANSRRRIGYRRRILQPLLNSPSWQKIHRRGAVDESGRINIVSAPKLIFGKRRFTNNNRNMIYQPSVA